MVLLGPGHLGGVSMDIDLHFRSRDLWPCSAKKESYRAAESYRRRALARSDREDEQDGGEDSALELHSAIPTSILRADVLEPVLTLGYTVRNTISLLWSIRPNLPE